MITWAFDHLGLLIFVFVVFQVVRAVIRAAKLSADHKAGADETEEQKRMREIQERIRRKIAERRGGAAPMAEPPRPPLMQPNVAPLDPFGGPSRRLVIETIRRATQPDEPTPTEMAILERQQQLAAQMRALEEARVSTERRAAQVVSQRANAAASASSSLAPHAAWLGDLRDRQTLRRAFLLREVLGPPVALR